MWTALLWTLLGDAASKLAVLATTFVAVRALNPAAFGAYIALSAAALLAASVWDAGIGYLITREFGAGRISVRRGLSEAFWIRLRLLPVWLMAFALGAFLIGRSHSAPTLPIILFAAASALSGVSMITLGFLRGALGFRAAGLALAIGRWFALGLSALSFSTHSPSSRFTILAFAVAAGEGITILATAVSLLGSASGQATHAVERHLTLREAIPFGANSLIATAYNRFDVVILAALTSFQQLSFYAPASRIQDGMYIVPSSLGAISLPLMTRAFTSVGGLRAVDSLIKRLIGFGLLLATPIAVLVTFFAVPIIATVLGANYVGAATPARILVWFLPIAAVEAPILGALAATGNAKQTTKVFGAALATALVGHFSLDWWAGANGGAVASLLRDPVAVLVAVSLARRVGLLR